MAILEPFAALRPRPDLANQICAPPYDVLSSEEARAAAKGNPLSFLRVSKPEINLPPGTPPDHPEVYVEGQRHFQDLIRQGALQQDDRPHFYLYGQATRHHRQVGLVALASCEDYLNQVVKRHELTRPAKETDRVQHMEALNAQTGPAFLVYRAQPQIDDLVQRQIQQKPAIDFTSHDQVRHSAWMLNDDSDLAWLRQAFAEIPTLYIADGHHRSAAAVRVFQTRQGQGGSPYFLAVLFPHHQIQILGYHRAVTDLNGLSPEKFRRQLAQVCDFKTPTTGEPNHPHEWNLFLDGQWQTLRFHDSLVEIDDPVAAMDVSLLQKHILGPLLNIEDPRTSRRIRFIGGNRGAAAGEELVRQGKCAAAFYLQPLGVENLMSVADAGGLMPPKSTWFEPKLRDALFCHRL